MTLSLPPVGSGDGPYARDALIARYVNSIKDWALPPDSTLVTPDGSGEYSTLSEALAATPTPPPGETATIAVRGIVRETATITPKSRVKVVFMPGAELICEGTAPSSRGVLFTNVIDAKWVALSPRTATIRRMGASGDRNYVVEVVNNLGGGLLELEGLVIENLTHNTSRNYGIEAARTSLSNCIIKGAGLDRPYGALLNVGTDAYLCDAYGGDTTIGGAGGSLAVGWITSSAGHTGKLQFCRGFGGNTGAGIESYGFWLFAYSMLSEIIDCVGYGGSGAGYSDGLNCHISATANLVRCHGYSGNRGHGMAVYSTDNYATHHLVDCFGYCLNQDGSSLDWHGLSLGGAIGDYIEGGSFYGSPYVADSCGLRVSAAATRNNLADYNRATIFGSRFYGGGAGKRGQNNVPAPNAGCHGIRVDALVPELELQGVKAIGNSLSHGLYLPVTATPDNLYVYGGVYRSMNPANEGILSVNDWLDAQMYHAIIPGGLSANITPSAGDVIETNVVPASVGLRGRAQTPTQTEEGEYPFPVSEI